MIEGFLNENFTNSFISIKRKSNLENVDMYSKKEILIKYLFLIRK